MSAPSTKQQTNLTVNWHPYAQMKELDAYPPPVIQKAEGRKLIDESGHYIYDTIASWWCNVHGHAHPAIAAAIARQSATLPHVMFGGLTHEPAITLSESLVKITPEGLDRVFYTDNGSCAVEVALKMSFQYWQHVDQPQKTRILYLENGYHGDTLGTMAVSGVDVFHGTFSHWMFPAEAMPVPNTHTTLDTPTPISEEEALATFTQYLDTHHDTVAAIIVEPLAQCAGGMRFYSPTYLKAIRELATRYNCHLIADEIASGFGRTGKMWACDWASITPDFMCVSKGLTSGTLPLAATLTTNTIYDAFYGDYTAHKTFYHGHTFTANPIACAAANASLALFESESTLENGEMVSAALEDHATTLARHPNLSHPRTLGAIAAFDIVQNKDTRTPFADSERLPFTLYQAGLRHHVMLRPLGNTIYLFPPISTTKDELDQMIAHTLDALNEVFGT